LPFVVVSAVIGDVALQVIISKMPSPRHRHHCHLAILFPNSRHKQAKKKRRKKRRREAQEEEEQGRMMWDESIIRLLLACLVLQQTKCY